MPAMSVAEAIDNLRELQATRRFCITSQSRCDRSIEAFIARKMGYSPKKGDTTGKEVFKRASAVRKAVEEGREVQTCRVDQRPADLSATYPMILLSAQARKTWDDYRKEIEREMLGYVRLLPGFAFAQGVRGFGDLALAAIIGETGDLSEYKTKEKVWKRLGLAVIEGERQQRKSDKDMADKHGYSPGRRAQVWAFCSDSMFRAQWCGDKDEDGNNPVVSGKPVAIPAHPIGPYGEVYLQAKVHATPRIEATKDFPDKIGNRLNPDKWTKARVHNHARRLMTKALLRDLWLAWHAADGRNAVTAEEMLDAVDVAEMPAGVLRQAAADRAGSARQGET